MSLVVGDKRDATPAWRGTHHGGTFTLNDSDDQKVPEFEFTSRTSHWLVHYIIPARIHRDL